jgi:CubicO group peptidase (beta-lactamase class C family)
VKSEISKTTNHASALMKRIFKLGLLIALVFGLSGNDIRIASANFNKSEVLTDQENLDLCKIFSSEKIARIDSLLNYYAINNKFNGNVLIALDGFNVYQRSIGFADPIKKISSKPETVYQLASVSKQFTAAAIMLLKADGKLGFDDLLIKYIPELPYKNITIRHLLHHVSGLPNYMYLTDKYWTDIRPPDNNDVIELMAKYKIPVFFQPGARYDYSNTGYVMLASVVERVSGMSLNDFLQQRIFRPLGMKSTYVYSTADTNIKRNHIDGFKALKSGYSRIQDTRNNGPVGDKGVCSTTGDMFNWDRALYMGSPLNQALLDEAFSPTTTTAGKEVPYGYGFRIRESNGGKVIYHNGLWEGARTNFHRYLDSQNTIIVMNNTSTRINHELVRQIETIIGSKDNAVYTEILARMAIEEGVDPAVDYYNQMLDNDSEVIVNFDKIDSAAAYLQKAGKTEKAAQLEKMSNVCRELAGI